MVTIHQPEFMPYGGFFAKALRSDLFILLDTVQFAKNNWQNRNKLLIAGEARWVTVPVQHKQRLEKTIAQTELAADPTWARKLREAIRVNYRSHPQFDQVYPFFEGLLAAEHTHIAPLNVAIIRFIAERLQATCQWRLASEMTGGGSQSELLAALTAEAGGDCYLSGAGGRNYLEQEPFTRRGLSVRFHDYHPVAYPQSGAPAFVPYLSVVDLLFCCPPAEAREILLAGSEVSTE